MAFFAVFLLRYFYCPVPTFPCPKKGKIKESSEPFFSIGQGEREKREIETGREKEKERKVERGREGERERERKGEREKQKRREKQKGRDRENNGRKEKGERERKGIKKDTERWILKEGEKEKY